MASDETYQFSVHVYCGQTAGWIKMARSTEVVLGSGHIVLDGDPATLPKMGQNPLRIGHVIRRMRSGCRRIVNGILWDMSELITQERIALVSSNLVDG